MRFFRKLRRRMPKRHDIQSHRSLSMFRTYWHFPELWAMNRSSIAKGIAIGLFSAFLPMPFEMVVAIFLAVFFRGNVIFAFSLVWISNPFTWIPLYTPCYLLGAWIIQLEPIALSQMTTLRLNLDLAYHYVALWLGCLIVGTVLSASSFALVHGIWRTQVRSEWQQRKLRRKQIKQASLNK
ncbi:MAG: DUF2062 domain-containing protein [Arenicella sp.]